MSNAPVALPNVINSLSDDDVAIFKSYSETDQTVMAGNLFDLYQRLATKSAIYPGQGTPLGLQYVAMKGAGEAGEFAEHVGKACRDDSLYELGETSAYGVYTIKFNDLTEDRREKLIKEVGDDLWYVAAKCNELGITMSWAAFTNLQKLADRTKRDKLRGSGDDR